MEKAPQPPDDITLWIQSLGGISEEERQALESGVRQSLTARQADLRYLTQLNSGIKQEILLSIGQTLHQPHVQEALAAQRQNGSAASWLQEQAGGAIHQSLSYVLTSLTVQYTEIIRPQQSQ